jgi:hypothetical protein
LLVAGWPFFGNGFKFRPGVTYDLPKGALNWARTWCFYRSSSFFFSGFPVHVPCWTSFLILSFRIISLTIWVLQYNFRVAEMSQVDLVRWRSRGRPRNETFRTETTFTFWKAFT